MGRKTLCRNHPKKIVWGLSPTPCYTRRNVTARGANRAKNITQTPTKDYDPSVAKTRPLNQKDNQDPQPEISHLETDYSNSIATTHVGLCSNFRPRNFFIFTIMFEGQLKLRSNSVYPQLLPSLTCLQDSS
jgi:hypothetical protein